jgi:hypothetical protein
MLLLALPALGGGCAHAPLPLPMAPVPAVALKEPLSGGTLAVLDFVDARPEFERGPHEIDEFDVGGRWIARDSFWYLHTAAGELPADPAPPPDVRARVTGEAAFAWYPFPNHGLGRPLLNRLELALPDYLALHLEQRRVFFRVVRVRDAAAAREVGATFTLGGRIDRFGALFAEVEDPYVVRADEPLEYRLLAAVRFQATLAREGDASPLLERDCLGRDEEADLRDHLPDLNATPSRSLRRLDAEDVGWQAREDMATHARRALERATAPLIAAVETALAPAPPAQ